MQCFQEEQFNRRMQAALRGVKSVLDTTRNPVLPSAAEHAYDDKYTLAEIAIRTTLAAQMNLMESLGLDSEKLSCLQEWRGNSRMVKLQFNMHESCTFDRTEEHDSESAVTHVTEVVHARSDDDDLDHRQRLIDFYQLHNPSMLPKVDETLLKYAGQEQQLWSNLKAKYNTTSITNKTVTKITDHFWHYSVEWSLMAYAGGQSSMETKPLLLCSRKGSCELKTRGKLNKISPCPAVSESPTIELDIDFPLQCFDGEQKIQFDIDRATKGCHTPRRNAQVQEAVRYLEDHCRWANQVRAAIQRTFFKIDPSFRHSQLPGRVAVTRCNTETSTLAAVSPVLSMLVCALEKGDEGEVKAELRRESDLHAFLQEHKKLHEQQQEVNAKICAGSDDASELTTVVEMNFYNTLVASADLCQQGRDALDSVEAMLYQQLQAAIGKEIGPADFTEYMAFHNRRLFKEEYRPKSFCFTVRRPDHYPEGTLAIEYGSNGSNGSNGSTTSTQQLSTLVSRQSEVTAPMRFALNASTDVSFSGERLLHASVLHTFSSAAPPQLQLQATARQFSSYILLVGRIAASDVFEPTAAVIIKDKDDLKIPLLLETMPTPKAFRDTIESMSPEQQRFCKAFRGMQLASTICGVLVIQIKPQIERLLNLPDGALTKEIRLTQDLMTLFIEHQIPSDLISFGGDPSASAGEKLAAVKEHVSAVNLVITEEKEAELKEAELKRQKAVAEHEPFAMRAAILSPMCGSVTTAPTRGFSFGGGRASQSCSFGGGGGFGYAAAAFGVTSGGGGGGGIVAPAGFGAGAAASRTSKGKAAGAPAFNFAGGATAAPAPAAPAANAPANPFGAAPAPAPMFGAAPAANPFGAAPASAAAFGAAPAPAAAFGAPTPFGAASSAYGAAATFGATFGTLAQASGFCPTSPAYSPTSPAYSPTSPAYSPTSPAYNPMSMSSAPPPGMIAMCPMTDPLCITSSASSAPSKQQQQQPQQPQQHQPCELKTAAQEINTGAVDYTTIPQQLDRQYEKLDEDSALRPTIITAGPQWQLSSQAGLLSKPRTTPLHANEQAAKKAEAFHLLDALSRSGEIHMEHASLHVIIAATHCFDQSLVDTVIQGSVNPIDKVERSTLIVAGVIHKAEVTAMVNESEIDRISQFAPKLLEAAPSA
jgi:hypothetical protein